MTEKNNLEIYKLKIKKAILEARSGDIIPFTKVTKPDYKINWHHEILGYYLNKFIRKEITRLMVFMPPRHGKSELTSRRLPALLHGLYPNDEILAFSYNNSLASDMTVDVQRIMDLPEYAKIFPKVRISPENSSTGFSRNNSEHEIIPFVDEKNNKIIRYTGTYKGAGVGGTFTGLGGDWVLGDDPIKNRDDADSLAFRERLYKFYSSTIRTRLEKNASILITQTRWHEDDLAGRLLKLQETDPEADKWVVLNLPAIKMNDDCLDDPRKIGEALWREKYDEDDLRKTKASVGSREWSALYQQSPTSEGGNIIKEEWIKYYHKLPDQFDSIIQSWDFAVKDKATSDFTVGQVWGRKGADKYFIHQVRGRFDFPTSCQKVVETTKLFPKSHKKLIEAKANGSAVVQTLRKHISGLVEVEPRGDKIARTHAISPEFESGNVYLPHPDIAPWISDYISELISFPTAVHDDQVDATTQALDELISQENQTEPRIRIL
jgi:predicted phage terminase large subunit-like protein